MKHFFTLLTILALTACSPSDAPKPHATAASFTPSFVVDYQKCGNNPVINNNSVTFGSDGTCQAGRVVSTHGYKNITRIEATVDISKLNNNYVIGAFYMVSNPVSPAQQPIHTNYCDAGGNNPSWNCQEIDFFETNSNKVLQSTMHLGTGSSDAPQRFELSYTSTAEGNSCFDQSKLTNNPAAGAHSMVGVIDVSKPFQMVSEFTYGTTPRMTVTYSQNGNSVVVYDTANGSGYNGSKTLDYSYLINSMAQGYWLELSMWQSENGQKWAPGQPQGWWNGSCGWDALCNTSGYYWGISNIVVTADSEI